MARCYVYVLHYSDLNTNNIDFPDYIKIGISENPKRRVKDLSHSHPGVINIEYIKVFENREYATKAERLLHTIFHEYRVKFEYFAVKKKQIIDRVEKEFGISDDLKDLDDIISNINTKPPNYMRSSEFIKKIDKTSDYTNQLKYDEYWESLKKEKSPFREDPILDPKTQQILKEKAREKNIHLYDKIENPLSNIYQDKPLSIGFKVDEIINEFYADHPKIKNRYFSEFLTTISDHWGWPLREVIQYEKENSENLHLIGSGDRNKENLCKKEILKFHDTIEHGPNILTTIDILWNKLEYHKGNCQFYENDQEAPKKFLLPPPIGWHLSDHPMLGPCINFWVLDYSLLEGYERFGRSLPDFKRPATIDDLSPLFFLFDVHGYTPFVTLIKSRGGSYKCEIISAVGIEDFSEETAVYYHTYGMRGEDAVEKALGDPDKDYELKCLGYGWEV